MTEEKVEIYNFSLENKNSGKIKFEGKFLNELFDLFSKDFMNFVDTFPPTKLKNKTVKIEKDEQGKSVWKYSKKTKRLRGILIVGKDSDKVLKFTKLDKLKSSGGKKGKGLNIDKPYFFELIFLENKTKGFLILQNTDNTSCKKVLEKLIQEQLKQKYGNLTFTTSRFIEEEIFKNYLQKGNYNEVTFIRNRIPDDVLQDYLGDYHQDGIYSLSTKIKAEGESDFASGLKNKIFESFEEGKSFFEIPELKEAGFEETSSYIKVNSTFDGKTRTIDLSDTLRIRPQYPLSEVAENEEGFAEFESIGIRVTELLRELDVDIL